MPYHPDKDALKAQGMDGRMEKVKEAERDKESDTVDGFGRQFAGALVSHQKAADKHKFHSVGHQKKKLKVRPVATLGKGFPKSRGPHIQDLFSDRPDKTPMQEERGGAGGGQSPMEVLKQTLQSFPVPDKLNWGSKEGDKYEVLEKSWTDLVHSHKTMPKTQRHQQEALWELLYTEIIYINKLTIITDLVLAALEHVHRHGFLNEVSSAQLFSNIPSILDAHRCFWLEVMHPMLQNVRLTGQPFDPLKLDPGCLQFADRFSAYLDYCWEEERNLEFTRRQQEINPQFNIFLMWVETHPQCGRMRLGDMQAKPHQRITKYPLLLKAILKTTQDSYTQQTLDCMINSVSQFLDSINDYLLFKDDELALFAMSQKIEGYELHGMSEEIEKHMQEFCRFDLTTPIRGTEPKVIRKLIMGETLKVRGRKDSKLEVVVLLFTDVLLLTKTQKKSDKQKVVRPPLSLDRIHCAELKDGYSFVLMEVSDLGCPVSVYSVSTPSPESCAVWITTIHQAQEALQSLRKPEEPRDQILEESEYRILPVSLLNISDTEEQLEYKSHFGSLRFTTVQLDREEENLHNQHVHSHFLSKQMQNGEQKFNDKHNTTKETEQRDRGKNGHCESKTDIVNNLTIERRVTWNHKVPTQKKSNAFPQQDSFVHETNKSSGPHNRLVGELRENKLPTSGQFLLPSKFTPAESAIIVGQQQSQKPDLRQDSWSHQSGDENEPLSGSWTFTRILNSPRLRRKRPMNSQPSAPLQGPRRMSADVGSSNSVSDSEENHNVRRPSNTSVKTEDHLVLKMASVKQNRGAFWNVPYERSSDSESELPKETYNKNFHQKIPKIKPQRSESFPEIKSSPLQGLLNRAMERERERGIAKIEGKHLEKTSLQSSNTDCTTLSSSPSKRESEAEDWVMFGARWFGPHTRTETSVDSSDNDRKNRPVTPLGVTVDWPGWCFDDEDVLEFTDLDDETSDWFEKTLSKAELRKTPRHSDADYSEV
ncbi:uncharacterized protein plekhg6 [Tachysurus vachellii]|uniref:uncharacterized protein plekhg6 n=1 Tax=Tachysurus vachellii TaxID=175792 RepID=UPI00296B05E3|nr:uncharacterized protein plekhg6 [Tachysurus vachellii]XP_060726205.1 uncharacterized protein plekhg6 [Tachysurus vachellii]XP_060726206.1 uncharacterized protein plekhg6 [Tachysurus vachellii]